MKKIVNINLGGYPFTIDVDAYEKMESYFSSLEKYFSNYDNPHEIIFDIEIRMAELFKENAGTNAILSSKDVAEAIKVLGTPEDFSKEESENPEEEYSGTENKQKKKEYRRTRGDYRVGRKIFRDPNNKVIGGVCSGLAAYFGIPDPIWIRLLFVLLVVSGISPVIYIILLILIPKARTEADLKEMRGEPIDIDTIAKSIEDEISNITDQFQDMASSFKNRRKDRKRDRRDRRNRRRY